jgi:uncharacterized protein with HEPN domain
MLHKDRIRLQHLLDEAYEACSYVESISFDDFVQDGKTVRAVIRSIEVIGEAASKISLDLRKAHPDIPWQKIIGMRNRLIHVYFDIDYDVLWHTLKENIPSLIEHVGGQSKPAT